MKNQVLASFLLTLTAILLFSMRAREIYETDRLIRSDGKGYYAYLPALLIYDDPNFSFTTQIENKYYPLHKASIAPFTKETDSGTVNKYFPGLALLWLPFFLLAHGLSHVADLPADGYSFFYQWAIAVSLFVWLFLGLCALFRIFQRVGIDFQIAVFSISIVMLGSNMVYYFTDVISMTHIYSFALINIFLLSCVELRAGSRNSWLQVLMLSSALILIVRPLNVFVLLIAFLFYFKTIATSVRNAIITEPVKFAMISIVSLAILFLAPLLWFWQNGNWIIYSYGEEKLNLLNPSIFKILFSTHHGWLLFSPVFFFAIPGVFPGLKKKHVPSWFIVVYFLIMIYLLSCWWSWWYGSGYGNRAFIDHYGIMTIALGIFVSAIPDRKQIFVLVPLVGLCLMNLIHLNQYRQGILPDDQMTFRYFAKRYFATSPVAIADLNPENYKSLEQKVHLNNSSDLFLSDAREFCELAKINELLQDEIIYIQLNISANQLSDNLSLVTEYSTPDADSTMYLREYISRFLKEGRTRGLEFAFPVEAAAAPQSGKIYLWDPELKSNLLVKEFDIRILQKK